MQVRFTPEFEKRFKKLEKKVQLVAVKQEEIFRVNPQHPSLRLEKLEPHARGLWSIRINTSYRILLEFSTATSVVFITVGPHDWLYDYASRI